MTSVIEYPKVNNPLYSRSFLEFLLFVPLLLFFTPFIPFKSHLIQRKKTQAGVGFLCNLDKSTPAKKSLYLRKRKYLKHHPS